MSSNGGEPVGVRLKRLRLERGLSQRDLSSPGTSYAYISRIEAGARTPSVKALRALADKLGVTVEFLETGRDHTIDDDLMTELYVRAKTRVVRIVATPGHVALRWKRQEVQRDAQGYELTEALLNAVAMERELDEILAQKARLDLQERSVLLGQRPGHRSSTSERTEACSTPSSS